MLTVDVSLWERLLEAVVELGRLPGAGVRRDAFAQEFLRAALMIPGVAQARFLFVEDDHVWGYGVRRGVDALQTERLPRARIRGLAEGRAARRTRGEHPREVRALLGSARAEEVVVMPFQVPAQGASGAVAVWSEVGSLPEESEKVLGLLARHAEQLLDHTRVLRSLEYEARTDGLTGVFNYRHFMEALHTETKRAERFEERFPVLMVDVDNLKQYNDRYGHLAGSSALKELADLLRRGAREIDVVAKYGGDEFSLLLPNTSLAGAISFAERILGIIRGHSLEGDPERRLSVSVGIALFPDDGVQPRTLLSCADRRLYAAKAGGRDRVCAMDSPADHQRNQRTEGNKPS